MNVDDIVRERIEAARRKIAARKKDRAAFAAARSRGLARRHAAKLRRQAETNPRTTADDLRSPDGHAGPASRGDMTTTADPEKGRS